MTKLSNSESEYLARALISGRDYPISNRTCKSLRKLVKRGLLERKPTSYGDSTQWRPTQKAIDQYEVL